MTRRRRRVLWGAALALGLACRPPVALESGARPASALTEDGIARLRGHVHAAWPRLTRTLADLPTAAIDPKLPHTAGTPWLVYFPRDVEPSAVRSLVEQALSPAARTQLDLRPLPSEPAPALLFLPRPYVVPGGRFNEMYGWDSYFILLGLLRDGEDQRAQDLVDDFLYEATHYGGVLNANRTYYLTRSQPPLLAAMVLALFRVTHDKVWLAQAQPALRATWAHWTSPPHAFAGLALSRYFDHGDGPAPEVVAGERDADGHTHYDRVREAFRRTPEDPQLARYYDAAHDALTPLFYKGDRSMRESGFDPSQRFGHFGADVIHLAPVCLNTLLARYAADMAAMDDVLDPGPPAELWRQRLRERARAIDEHLWDEAAGLYFDLDVETGRRRAYPFATTFWPLAMGLASPHQAARVRENLPLFERPGGIRTSTVVTGNQWDAPFGWAPLQLFAVEGLRRNGFSADAQRLARAFLSMLTDDLARRGTLVEKYDVERRTSDTGALLRYGYASNEVGFGWTNGVALELLAGLD